MNLRQTLRAGVAAIAVASVVAPAGAATSSIDVRVAQSDGFSRIEFRGAPDAKVKKDGQVLVFTFPRDADLDIARLHTAPPKWIKTAEKKHVGGHLQLSITLTDDADYKVGSADGATFVNVFAKAPPTAAELAAAKAAIPEPQRANPVPAGGVDAHGLEHQQRPDAVQLHLGQRPARRGGVPPGGRDLGGVRRASGDRCGPLAQEA